MSDSPIETGTTDTPPVDTPPVDTPPAAVDTPPAAVAPVVVPQEVVLEALTGALAAFKQSVIDPLREHVTALQAKVDALFTNTQTSSTGVAAVTFGDTPAGEPTIDTAAEETAIEQALGVPEPQNPPTV